MLRWNKHGVYKQGMLKLHHWSDGAVSMVVTGFIVKHFISPQSNNFWAPLRMFEYPFLLLSFCLIRPMLLNIAFKIFLSALSTMGNKWIWNEFVLYKSLTWIAEWEEVCAEISSPWHNGVVCKFHILKKKNRTESKVGSTTLLLPLLFKRSSLSTSFVVGLICKRSMQLITEEIRRTTLYIPT